jgi:hypothetical protein
MGGITQLWLCPYPQEKKEEKKNLFKQISFQKQFLQTLQTCAQRKSAHSTQTQREIYIYIYIYYIVANFTTKWDFFFQINFFFFTLGITPTVINLSVKTLSLSLSLSLSPSLSLCDLCVCLQLQRYLGQFHKVYNFEQQQCNSSEAVRLASASSVKN